MAGDLRLVTQNFMSVNFGSALRPPNTLSYEDTLEMSMAQIRAKFNVNIDGIDSDNRCPSQNQISAFIAPTDLFFPDAFSPNGDGVHDTFMIQNLASYPVNHMRIYDQGGTTIFETDSYHLNWWNGRYGNTGSMAPAGTYYYVCTINHISVKQSFVFMSY